MISKTMEIMVFVEVDMHKIFGIKEDKIYLDRKGAYLVPIRGEKVGVVETTKGYFLLGGGIDGDETDNQCIIRECIEEAGYQVETRAHRAEPVDEGHAGARLLLRFL